MSDIPSPPVNATRLGFRLPPPEPGDVWSQEAAEGLKGQVLPLTAVGHAVVMVQVVDARLYTDPALGDGLWVDVEVLP